MKTNAMITDVKKSTRQMYSKKCLGDIYPTSVLTETQRQAFIQSPRLRTVNRTTERQKIARKNISDNIYETLTSRMYDGLCGQANLLEPILETVAPPSFLTPTPHSYLFGYTSAEVMKELWNENPGKYLTERKANDNSKSVNKIPPYSNYNIKDQNQIDDIEKTQVKRLPILVATHENMAGQKKLRNKSNVKGSKSIDNDRAILESIIDMKWCLRHLKQTTTIPVKQNIINASKSHVVLPDIPRHSSNKSEPWETASVTATNPCTSNINVSRSPKAFETSWLSDPLPPIVEKCCSDSSATNKILQDGDIGLKCGSEAGTLLQPAPPSTTHRDGAFKRRHHKMRLASELLIKPTKVYREP